MDETKIPHKGDFGMATEKNFFAATEPNIPHKTNIPHKPNQAPIPSDTEGQPQAPDSTPISPQPALSQKESEDAFDKKVGLEKVAKPFENVSGGLAPLRTYRQDVAGVMRDQKTSLVRLVLEEQKERNKREQEISPTSHKNLPLIILSVFFLFSSVGLVYYIYFQINPIDHTLSDLQVTPLIFVEKNKEVSVDGKGSPDTQKEIASLIKDEGLKVDVIEYLFFTETLSAQTPNGAVQKKNLILSDRFFETLGIKTPPMFLRSLRPDFMLGIHSFNKNQPFLILKTDYYDNAFAGMLGWENKLAEDLLPVFGEASLVPELSQRKWGDTVIKNKDTRTLRNFDGSIALVYVFKDQHTLIITTSEDTLLEVSRRLDLTQEKQTQ